MSTQTHNNGKAQMGQCLKKQAALLPLTNVYSKGDYTAELMLGSEQNPVNLILDTGSSTLVVSPKAYQAQADKALQATSLVQEVNYGIGGWAGPVVETSVAIRPLSAQAFDKTCLSEQSEYDDNNKQAEKTVVLENVNVAIAQVMKANTFADADGILGLAYHHLNKGFDLTNYLSQTQCQKETAPPVETTSTKKATFPWPFSQASSTVSVTPSTLKQFKHFLWQQPESDLTPYFTQLSSQGLEANKFAFYSHRSNVYHPSLNCSLEQVKTEPLNQGYLVLGGGEDQEQFYHGDFQSIPVSHDVYYNVELISLQLSGCEAINAKPLAAKDVNAYFTNAIVDTGASLLVLTEDLFDTLVQQFSSYSAKFADLLTQFKTIDGQKSGIDANLVDFKQWPTLYFTFRGLSENSGSAAVEKTVTLACEPENYWQINAPEYGKVCFKLLSQLPNWPNQSIIGLPLLNNYFVVFDRSATEQGIIKFAQKRLLD